MGGAELRVERRDVDGESSVVSARPAREGAVAAARAATEPGLHLSARRRRDGDGPARVRGPLRAGRGASRRCYRGTVWIDRELYVRLKVQAVESNLTGMVVSNDETQNFSRAGELQGRPVWLLDRLTSQQMFLIAGRTVLVEREARLTDVVLNPGEFEAERDDGAGEQPHHVPRHRSGAALPGEAGRDAGRQQRDDHVDQGVGARRAGRSVVRLSAAARRPRHPRFQFPQQEPAVRAVVRRRLRRGEHPAAEPVGRTLRRQRGFLLAGGEVERLGLRRAGRADRPSAFGTCRRRPA